MGKPNITSSEYLNSIIIPMYNEENTIQDILTRIPNHHHYEIIVVDDWCADTSIQKVNGLNHDNIKVLTHITNRGYGAAILTGLKHARGEIIVSLDSDGLHRPQEIPSLIDPIINNECDIVIGSRYLGDCTYKVPFHNRIGEYLIDFALWLLFNQNVKNNQSGFRVFYLSTIKLFDNLIYNKLGLCTEIIFKVVLHGLRMKEVPITVKPRRHGTSYVNMPKIPISINFFMLIYVMKKFKLLDFIPKIIIEILSTRLIK